MADQHRGMIELAYELLVVVDDLLDSEAGGRFGGLADLLDIAMLARPLGRRYREPSLSEVVGVVLPASCREPRPVDQHQRDLAVLGLAGFHPVSSFEFDLPEPTSS